jgi:hypothetical protein
VETIAPCQAIGQNVNDDALIAGIVCEQVKVDPAQPLLGTARPEHDDVELGMIVIMAVVIAVLVIVVPVIVTPLLIVLVVIMIMPMIVMGVVSTAFMIVLMMVVFVEAVGMRVDRVELATAARIQRQPGGAAQTAQNRLQLRSLVLVARRVFKTDQVDARNFQLQPQCWPVQSQVANGLSVNMRFMVPQGTWLFGIGQAVCGKKHTGGQQA